MGRESILINKSLTDLRAVEQLTDNEQLNGLAALLLEAAEHKMDGRKTLVQVVDLLEKQMDEKGLASLLAPGKARRSGTAETAGNLCMPEPVQGTAVLRKFVTIQSHKKSSGKPCSFQNLSVWLKILFYLLFFNYLFPTNPHNRLREDHNAFFQAFDFHELVCSVHTVVDFKVCASKRNTVFSDDAHTFRRRSQMVCLVFQ